ncbi:HIT family protein [Buchananella hordeovulneris]|uniref:HIT family protein n=1 Tax=Buchananella hordeovulneris TaxID=52770 RepID=UPI000F5F38E3|nr:HIT family protein [Buchananella hordeovulneris]
MVDRNALGRPGSCPFCERVGRTGELPRNDLAASVLDAFPRAPGHVLIVPLVHESDYFELPAETQEAMFSLLPEVRNWQQRCYRPTGWTIRINVGLSAGQSVAHVHMHVLPSYGHSPHDAFKYEEPL